MPKLRLEPGDEITPKQLAQWQEAYDDLFARARREGLVLFPKVFSTSYGFDARRTGRPTQ